jgi:DNA-binding response OmpR family regulator
VQEHGGRIRIESPPSLGASFFVEFPVNGTKLSPAPVSRSLEPTKDPIPGSSVLLVEDETALAAAVTDALRDAGYLVDRAANGEEALARMQERSFDVVVCDLRMPRLDGKAFYRRLSAAAPHMATRVVFVTGDVAGTDSESFLEESGCRWLAKPFRLADLLRSVREVLS